MLIIFSEKILASKSFALVGCHVVLLFYSMEERDGEDGDDGNGCRALAVWKSGGAKHQSSR